MRWDSRIWPIISMRFWEPRYCVFFFCSCWFPNLNANMLSDSLSFPVIPFLTSRPERRRGKMRKILAGYKKWWINRIMEREKEGGKGEIRSDILYYFYCFWDLISLSHLFPFHPGSLVFLWRPSFARIFFWARSIGNRRRAAHTKEKRKRSWWNRASLVTIFNLHFY